MLAVGQARRGDVQYRGIIRPMGAVDVEGVRLVAADDAAGILDDVAHALADAPQHLVAVGLAIALVDHVEVVHVDHDGVHGHVLVVHVVLLGVAIEEFLVVQPRQVVPLGGAQYVPVLRQLYGAQHPRQDHAGHGIGLGDEIDGPEAQALHLDVPVRGQHDHRQPGIAGRLLDVPQDVRAAHVGQVQVQQHHAQIVRPGRQHRQRLRARGGEDQIIGLLQHQRQQLPIDGLVLHDQEQPLVVGRMKFDVAVGHFFKSFLKVNSINVI